jgi:outer membrane murein-binding lipoprotein Lpp
MRQSLIDRTIPLLNPTLVMLSSLAIVGCVSTKTHTQTLTELETARKTSTQLQQQLDQESAQRKAAERQAAELANERESLAARSSELQSRLAGCGKTRVVEIAAPQPHSHEPPKPIRERVASHRGGPLWATERAAKLYRLMGQPPRDCVSAPGCTRRQRR